MYTMFTYSYVQMSYIVDFILACLIAYYAYKGTLAENADTVKWIALWIAIDKIFALSY